MNPFSLQCALFFLFVLGFHLRGFCSVELTSVPSVATDGEPLTLTCNTTEEEHDNYWFRNGDPIFVIVPPCSSLSNASILNRELFNKYLSGRVSVSCHGNQHNVTLTVDSDIDDGSTWWCDAEGRSNNVTIRMTSSSSLPTTHVSTSVPTSTTPTTSTQPSSSSSMTTSTAGHGVSPSTTTSRPTTTAKQTYPHTAPFISTFATRPEQTPSAKVNSSHTDGNKTAEEHGKEAPDVQHFYVVAGSLCGTAVTIVIVIVIIIIWTKGRHKQKEESAAIMQSEESNHFYINEAVQQDVDAV